MHNSPIQQLAPLAIAQYNVQNNNPIAVEQILYTGKLDYVFSPPFHGPRNVPIKATPAGSLSGGKDVSIYTHFPIIQNSGMYTVFLSANAADVSVVSFSYKVEESPGKFVTQQMPAVLVPDFPPTGPFGEAYQTVEPIPMVPAASHPFPVAIQFQCELGYPSSLEYIVVGAQ